MKKRILAILLVVSMLATLTACGDTGTETNNEVETTENSESVVESTESEITETEEEESVESTEIETVESEDTETVELESIEAESEEPAAPTYTYTDLSATMYAQSSVNVRDLPSTDGAKLGSLSLNQEVSVTGQCNETSWYRISYNGSEAYVSNKYLGDNKVEVSQPAQTTQTSDNSGNNASGENTDTVTNSDSDVCPVDLDAMWYDASEECVYYYEYDEDGDGLISSETIISETGDVLSVDTSGKMTAAHNLLEQSTGIKWFVGVATVDAFTWNGKTIWKEKMTFQEEGKPAPGEDSGVWW